MTCQRDDVWLLQGLRPNELAILFRNNHFNAIFCHANAIWILVTDQGYLFEKASMPIWFSSSWHASKSLCALAES